MTTERMTIAVHGATGTQGSAIARRLARAGHRVSPIARSGPVGVDLADSAAVRDAYSRADAVVLLLPLRFDDVADVHADAVLSALEAARVPRVVFAPGTALPAEPVGAPFVDARVRVAQRLRELPGAHAVVAPAGMYLDNLSAPWSASRLVDDGVLAYPLPADVPAPWLALDDLAQVVAEMLEDPEPAPESLVGGAPVTGRQLAAAIGTGLGRTVRWRSISPGDYERMLRPHLGAHVAAGVAAAYAAQQAAPAQTGGAPAAVRRAPTTPAQWARRTFAVRPAA